MILGIGVAVASLLVLALIVFMVAQGHHPPLSKQSSGVAPVAVQREK